MKPLRFFHALCLLALFAQVAGAQDFPSQLAVQGNLTDADGNPLNGEFGLDFAIYTIAIGGSPLLTQTQRVPVEDGFFNAILDVTSIPFDTLYWVGLSVEGGDELRPRLPLFPSPYSFSTRSLFGTSNVVPSVGNVGFGTRNPQAPLHVVGDVLFDDLRIVPPDSLLPFLVLDSMGIVRLAQPGPFLGGFNGMLQGVPLIVKDANGNEVFRVNTDGTSFHAGLETFAGGITLSGGVLTFPDGTTQETASEGGEGGFNGVLNNIPLIIQDALGDTQIQLNPDGTSFHGGQETFGGGIKSEGELIFEDAIRRFGGITPLPTSEPEDLEAKGLWRFADILRATGGLTAEQEIRMILDGVFVGGIVVLPTPEPEDLEAEGLWRFKETVRLLEGVVVEGDAQVNGMLEADEAAIEMIEAKLARFSESVNVNGTLSAENIKVAKEMDVFFAAVKELEAEEARLKAARALDEFIAEGGINITGGLLTFPDGSTQNSASGFDGMLQGVPLIVKDANGNEVFRVNTDGTSVHAGLERFNGGLVVPIPGVGDISISEFGVIIPLDNGGGISIAEDGISMVDGNGDEVFGVDPDGTSFHAGLETFAGGITLSSGVLTFPDGSMQNTAESFNGILNNIPLIIQDALGDTQIKLNPDGTSVHEGDSDINGDLTVNGNTTLTGTATLNGDAFMTGNATMVGDSDMTGNAILTGDATLNGGAFMTGNATMVGNLDVGGDPLLGLGNTMMTGNLTVGGNGQFDNDVNVNGTLNANVKNFKIDHPLDPAGHYLIHTSVESPDMMTVYNGNVVLDADGVATVEMPSYFEALNKDFRYQLTPIGGFAPVYVAEEIAGNRFTIAGGTPGMKVSWQVTGVRNDPYARAYRSPVELKKPAQEQGTYLHPELYGASSQAQVRRAPAASNQ